MVEEFSWDSFSLFFAIGFKFQLADYYYFHSGAVLAGARWKGERKMIKAERGSGLWISVLLLAIMAEFSFFFKEIFIYFFFIFGYQRVFSGGFHVLHFFHPDFSTFICGSGLGSARILHLLGKL